MDWYEGCGRRQDYDDQTMRRRRSGRRRHSSSTSVSADLHRRWVDLKSIITGKDEESILNECERGEDVAMKSYKNALSKDLPANIRSIVEKQFEGVQRNHDQVKALRDIARAS